MPIVYSSEEKDKEGRSHRANTAIAIKRVFLGMKVLLICGIQKLILSN
jgi:hypothetical protein